MPSLDFEVYCGICGCGCCRETTVDRYKVTITCPDCESRFSDMEKQIETLTEEIYRLEEEK